MLKVTVREELYPARGCRRLTTDNNEGTASRRRGGDLPMTKSREHEHLIARPARELESE
jgi:hypothetical protein